MKYEEVIKKIHAVPAGQFVNIETAKELKVRAELHGNKVVKFSHKPCGSDASTKIYIPRLKAVQTVLSLLKTLVCRGATGKPVKKITS